VPIFRTDNSAPGLTVAGVCAPKVLVSEAAFATLNPPELRTALRHEIAHALRYDNLKKLVFRFSEFPAMADLERAWSEQTEMAADDAAVSSFQDALDLAAALIKVSRLGPTESCSELTMALLHSSTALSARVQRLVRWEKRQMPRARDPWWYALPLVAVTTIGVAMVYGPALTQMHAVTEWLVR
jgi:Zn-dependent protease with chaperone function